MSEPALRPHSGRQSPLPQSRLEMYCCRSSPYSIRFSPMAIVATSSAPENLPAGWERWLVPSVADLIFVVLLALLAFTNLSVRLLGDAGIGWHIRTGQQILATHAIPHVA